MSNKKLKLEEQASNGELHDSLAKGELRLHQLPGELPAAEAIEVRRQALETISGMRLEHIGHHSLDVERASSANCENMIGIAQIPMGVVGPLPLRGLFAQGSFHIPLATTEGALIASVNRGCAAVRAAGGAVVWAEDVGMTRAPVFRSSGIEETRAFLSWVESHEDELKEVTASTSRYLRLMDVKPFVVGTSIFLRFRFHSGDAMGMNMATIACDRAVRDLIEPATGVECVALSGNYCVDKKPATANFQEGRGKRVHAEVVLPRQVLERTLKTTAEDLVEVQYRKNLVGSIAAGSQGYNAHFANILAAFFVATGQDLAHVVDGSLGVTSIELRESGSVYASIFLPTAPVGAVGGGTALSTQSEALSLLEVEPDPENPGAAAARLAEILAGVILAGELSLMAALTSKDLAVAHQRLAYPEQKP